MFLCPGAVSTLVCALVRKGFYIYGSENLGIVWDFAVKYRPFCLIHSLSLVIRIQQWSLRLRSAN